VIWYMQVHPGSDPGNFGPEVMLLVIRRFRDVGMGSARQWKNAPGAGPTRKRFKGIPVGDIAVIAHGREMFALVQFVGPCEPCAQVGDRWYELHRKVRLLCDDLRPYELAYIKACHRRPADGLPIRATLAAVRKNEFVGWLVGHLKADGVKFASSAEIHAEAPVLADVSATRVWKRDAMVVREALRQKYCEICGAEKTFPRDDGSQYFEAHHLIPMAAQASFANTLDVAANVVCLCPKCHRMIHYGELGLVRCELNKLYDLRQVALSKVGLKIGKKCFISHASRRFANGRV